MGEYGQITVWNGHEDYAPDNPSDTLKQSNMDYNRQEAIKQHCCAAAKRIRLLSNSLKCSINIFHWHRHGCLSLRLRIVSCSVSSKYVKWSCRNQMGSVKQCDLNLSQLHLLPSIFWNMQIESLLTFWLAAFLVSKHAHLSSTLTALYSMSRFETHASHPSTAK